MKLPPLPALRAFEAAARHLSFTRAAEELNVTQGAVSQQVKQLELYLGFKLFYRLPRKLEPTEEGIRLYRAANEAFGRIAGEVESLLAVEEAGVLTVSVLQSFAVKWLIPRLGGFRQLHPDIDVRVHADDRVVDFRADGIDVAVRFGRGGYAPLWSELLMDELIFPVCSPMLLAAGEPALISPRDLSGHVLLHDATARGFDLINRVSRAEAEAEDHDWSAWLKMAGVPGLKSKRNVTFNAGDMVVQAAVVGQGVAMARMSVSFDDLMSGLLVRPFPQTAPSVFSYYVACPEENLQRPRVRAFVDWLRAEAARCSLDMIPVFDRE